MASNFDFLQQEFKELYEAALKSESYVYSDARASCIYARMALEVSVHWLYQHDNRLSLPYDSQLGALIHGTDFRSILPEALFHKIKVIKDSGNLAVHNLRRPVKQWEALQNIKELFHLLYWVARTYHRLPLAEIGDFDSGLLSTPVSEKSISLNTLQLQSLHKQQETEARRLAAVTAIETDEREALQAQVAKARAENEAQQDTHDYSEAETRKHIIDLELARAGWLLESKEDREYPVQGMPTKTGIGYADYVLWADNGKPLAVVEAKRTTEDVAKGRQQAKLYADCLEQMHEQRPVIYYTNGYELYIWDDQVYPPRQVSGYHTQAELALMIQRRYTRKLADTQSINVDIAGRYYQKRAIQKICEEFDKKQRKCLLVMATGTGKTRKAIALVDILQRFNWVKRALFLADRISLVKQAVNAFKEHLPDSNPVNLCEERLEDGRVYVSTYPTMMGLIDQHDEGVARFGSGFFDLIIIDEAHRSVYQKYGSIFGYFDSLLIGLTATPRDKIDRNTYGLFELETGVPTDAYELELGVQDGFLVPPRVKKVDLRYPSKGIRYDDLSEDDKDVWESTDWGDRGDEGHAPKQVNAAVVNQWLFNEDTVDAVIKELMTNGHKVESGDRLAKTIIFARNHKHAEFFQKRFDKHYPHYAGSFARVIDNQEKYAQSLIEDFSNKNKNPRIAISVDMLDTGIDIPELANLVFFKPVYSQAKFWQMIGRGTRLCPDLYGPGDDKVDFRIFDFCGNFDFFEESPKGIDNGGGISLGAQIFNQRVRVLNYIDRVDTDYGDVTELRQNFVDDLCSQVKSMPKENFQVRMHLKSVEKFSEKNNWNKIGDDELIELTKNLSGLPTAMPLEAVETKQFDLCCLRMQLAIIESVPRTVLRLSKTVMEIAQELETKPNVPAIKAQLVYLQAIQTPEFWESINLNGVEELRIHLRDLAPFVDKKVKQNVYTQLKDEVIRVEEDSPIHIPKMTSVQYEKKVYEYIKSHMDHIAIHKLRMNEPLTPQDLVALEDVLIAIGEDQGQQMLGHLLERKEAPSLMSFIITLVGMDRQAAQSLFAEYLEDRSLSSSQIKFIETLIDQLTAHGLVQASALYEPPYVDIHDGGPDTLFAGKPNLIEGVFATLDRLNNQFNQEVSS